VVRDGDSDGLVIDLGAQRLPVDPALAAAHPGLADRVGQRVILGVRPEALDDAGLEPHLSGDRVLEATVDLVESLGAELVVHVAITGVGAKGATAMVADDTDGGDTSPAVAAKAIQAVGNVRQAAVLAGEVDVGDPGVTTVGAGEIEPIGDVSESAVADSEPDGEHWPAVVGRGGRAVARLSTRSRVRPGDTVKLAVDPTGLHLFDSTSGASLRTTGT
jgi:ABC-type sugar transport system ATPase subunit